MVTTELLFMLSGTNDTGADPADAVAVVGTEHSAETYTEFMF